ncbi:MAG: glycosyltransferase family 4 protein [Solirubrobacterales bacterium]|nr:glycosyltransferase family 4 protein [Solirubrobacterales bacterium]
MRLTADPARPLDVLIVSLGSTAGLRNADGELRDSLLRAGASVQIAHTAAPALPRTLMLTDLAWALAARAAASRALGELRSTPRAIVYSSTTAALLWRRPGAIRFDAPSAGNRPGRHGLWQRPLERRRLRQAPLLLPWSEGATREAPAEARMGDRMLVMPAPVEPSGPTLPAHERDITAITYAANPYKKGLDRVLGAWGAVCGELSPEAPRELIVAGVSERELRDAGIELEGRSQVRVVGALPGAEYRALLRRARVFVCAPRREDYGIAQLEALADGCLLVSTPAPGPYAALPMARALDRRLVSDDLESALLDALLRDPPRGYAQRALHLLAPFTRDAVDRLVAGEMLPRLLDGEPG